MSEMEASEKINLLAKKDNKNVLQYYNTVLSYAALPLSILGLWFGLDKGYSWSYFFIMGAGFALGSLRLTKYLDKKLLSLVKEVN